jgi:MarR family transcriptional regulator, negative regulator of the multidrug operon emrRAB
MSAILLDRLAAQLQLAIRDDAARHGLLPVQLQVLMFLGNANDYSDFALSVSEYLGLTRGTVSQTLSVLERDGYLTRRTDEHHGRRVHLDLTTSGKSVVADSWATRLSKQLTNSPTEQLDQTVALLLAALHGLNETEVFGVCRGCAHFTPTRTGTQCGLTGDPLAKQQTTKICREWTDVLP